MAMKAKLISLFIVCATFHSCTIWGTSEWQNLKDRNFIFARFTYSHLSAGKERAFAEMRSFNLEPVLRSLEKKHGISIDARQFHSFLNKGALADIVEEGILMTNSYIWETSDRTVNRAEIELKVNYGDDMRIMNYSYQVSLKVGGKVRAIYFDNVAEKNSIIPRILAHIGAGISEKDFVAQKRNVSEITGKTDGKIAGRRYETEGKIKDIINEYANTLSPENKKKFKTELIRYLSEEEK